MSTIDGQAGGRPALWQRLLWPDRTAVSDQERRSAVAQIARAQADGLVTADQAAGRSSRASGARTRADLAGAMAGLPGEPSQNLGDARRVLTFAWLGLSLIQIVVWLMICIIGQTFDGPWFLWSVGVGGVVVGALWMVGEAQHRVRFAVHQDNRSAQ